MKSQPQWRKHILKPFTRAALALEFVNSNLKELRYQVTTLFYFPHRKKLHYEIALCEVEVEDVLSKGKSHVEKAIKLCNNSEFSKFFLEPFKQRIELKLLMYSEPEMYSYSHFPHFLDPYNKSFCLSKKLRKFSLKKCAEKYFQKRYLYSVPLEKYRNLSTNFLCTH